MSQLNTANFVIGGTSRYAALTETIRRGGRATARTHESYDALFFVQDGTLAFMVDGFEGHVGKGGFVRVAAGSWYAYRNAGLDAAVLLSRLVPAAGKSGEIISIGVETAA